MHFIRTIKSEKEYNLNGEMWYASDIIEAVKADIQNIIDENTLPVEIEDIEIIGSYTRGENTPESDLDVLVQYSGDLSDDDFFNIIIEENLSLCGVKIDINPINSAKDSIENFKERNKGFTKKKSKRNKNKVDGPWFDFDGKGPYIVNIYVISKFSNIPEIDNLQKIFNNKIQAIEFAQIKFNKLCLKYSNEYNIEVSVYDNEHNLIKEFKNY